MAENLIAGQQKAELEAATQNELQSNSASGRLFEEFTEIADAAGSHLSQVIKEIGKWSYSGLDAMRELKKGPPPDESLKEGDIVFQSNKGGQGLAIQMATKSPLTHCGVLFKENGEWIVYEAVQPVRKTPLKEFAINGDDGSYVVKRMNDENVLNDEALKNMKAYLESNLGKNYDAKFQWSDDRIYCSELVWKAYFEATGLEVGKLSTAGDYDLDNPAARALIQERYGGNLPMDEKLVGPSDIYESSLLRTVN